MKKLLVLVPILAQCAWQVTHADATETKYWTESTYALQSRLVSAGYDKPLANTIINECKATAKNPSHCVITAAFVWAAESSHWQAVTGCNNVFGVTGWCYATRTDAVKVWVAKYNKYWFRRPNPSHFYSDTPKRKPDTLYCMSEESSGAIGYCPFGYKNAWKTFSLITR